MSSSSTPSLCPMCSTSTLVLYTCPRCHVNFCSVNCYQKRSHNQCSEAFYKKEVLKEMDLRNHEDKDKQMYHVMKTLRHSLEHDHDDDDVADDHDEGLDSDDDEALAVRLQDIDLDDVDAVWSRLTAGERRQFESMLESNEIEALVPPFQPWWIRYGSRTETFKVPKMHASLPPLKSVMSGKPSKYVQFGLVNVLFVYAYAIRFHRIDDVGCTETCSKNQGHLDGHGEKTNELAITKRVVDLCLNLSTNLSSNQAFDSFEIAVKSPEMLLSEPNQQASSVSDVFVAMVKNDLEVLLKGPKVEKDAFVVMALSDLRRHFVAVTKDREDEKRRLVCKRVVKKLDFYLQWVKEYYYHYF